MSGADSRWVPIASKWPAGLDTETDTIDLKDGQSPDAFGQDLDANGVLAKNTTVPTGVATPTRQFTLDDSNTYDWFYGRCWRIDSANLVYAAPDYQATFFAQDTSKVSTDNDTNSIIKFFPFAGSAMFIGKASGGYALGRANSFAGDFRIGDIEQRMKVDNADHAIEMEGLAYTSNADGLYSWDGQRVTEITENVRDKSASFASQDLTKGTKEGRLIGESFVYDSASGNVFLYSGSNFRFTSRTIIDKEFAPFMVQKLGFHVINPSEQRCIIKYQVKRDKGWEAEQEVIVDYEENTHAFVEWALENNYAATQFAVRITDITGGLQIRRIDVLANLSSRKGSWSQ